MSIKLMTEVWEKADAEGTKLLLLLALADMANDEGYCWPSYKYLARKIRVSPTHTIGLMKELVEEGWIEKEARFKDGEQMSNGYWIKVPQLTTVNPPPQPQLTTPINPSSPPPLTTVNPNHHLTTNEPSSNPVSEEKSRIVAALQRSLPPLDHSGLNVLDVSKYPEEVRTVIIKVCQLWNLRPPNGKDKAYWIEAGRELLDACGEFGAGVTGQGQGRLCVLHGDSPGHPPVHGGWAKEPGQFGPGGCRAETGRSKHPAWGGLHRPGRAVQPRAEQEQKVDCLLTL